MTLAASTFTRQGKRDDSYVMIEEQAFGQIEDIIWFPSKETALVVLRKYEKINIPSKNSALNITFPINQFPVKETNQKVVFVLDEKAYLQKIVRSDFRLKRQKKHEPSFPFFSVRPNPWFRW